MAWGQTIDATNVLLGSKIAKLWLKELCAKSTMQFFVSFKLSVKLHSLNLKRFGGGHIREQ